MDRLLILIMSCIKQTISTTPLWKVIKNLMQFVKMGTVGKKNATCSGTKSNNCNGKSIVVTSFRHRYKLHYFFLTPLQFPLRFLFAMTAIS
jgi:hypothetical protein